MERIAATDYHGIAKPSDPQLSPDGDAVAFVRSVPKDDESYEATIYLVPADGGEARRFTVSEGVDSSPRFSSDGDRLAFVSTRGGGDDRPQLWVAPTDGGEARRVTNVPGGVENPVWGPDGTRIAFVGATTEREREEGLDLDVGAEEYERETPDPRVVDRLIYRQLARYKDGARSHVYVVDLSGDRAGSSSDLPGDRAGSSTDSESGAVERITDGDYDFHAPEWGDDATLYYAVKRTDDSDGRPSPSDPVDSDGRPSPPDPVDPDDSAVIDVVAHDLDADEAETLVRTTAWAAALAATDDGRIAYPRTPEDRLSMRQTDVEVYDRGTGETTVVTADLDRTVDYGAGLAWGPTGDDVYFVTPDEGEVVVRRAAADGSGVSVVAGDGHATGFDVVTDPDGSGGAAVAFVKSEWDHPGDVFLAREGEVTRLTELNADYLADRRVGEPEEVRFESDGREMQGWVLAPPELDPDGSYPLAVEIHGGPHAMWSPSGTMWHEFQTLAARGYVVFWCNPRGSTGYGEAFATAIERDWGAVTMRDVMAGVDLVADREYVDESNLFVTGGSFGGFMTGWIVGHTDRFRAAVAQRGVYDLSSFYGSTDAFKLVEWDFGATPWEDPAFLWEQSPVAHAANVETPTLVIHADADFRVPVNNGEMFYLFLKKNGVDTRLVRYPREGHELSRSGEPGHVVDRIERIVRWFDGYSDHHDVPRALDRGDDGLTAGEDGGRSAHPDGGS
ncbi:S9 family peptidase [Halegenticoccus soli]|uniref:S9 family peptidase n=1 Tax=Halegenticoccus soli TaxID=1985678 RepID=UPI000C6E851B|nr:S9 family peptidase [Halegenticoccus soli]